MDLEKIRKSIDEIDREIVKLLSKRMKLGLQSKKFKEAAWDPERENEVLENVKKSSRTLNILRSDFVENLFSAIMKECRDRQETGKPIFEEQEQNRTLEKAFSRRLDQSSAAVPCAKFTGADKGEGNNNAQNSRLTDRRTQGMRIAVLGAGHMGGWLVRTLAPENNMCVYDLDRKKAEKLRQDSGCQDVVLLEGYSGLAHFKPEILINAVSLQNTIGAFEASAPYLQKNCVISDVASVKGKIPEFYQEGQFPFASVHPMFGPTFANVEQLSNENAVIIRESDALGARFFREFFKRLGLNIFEYTFDEHDRMIAYSLSLPFASTMVFAACMDNTAVPGTTFKKHLEIARGLLSEDDFLLSEILFNTYSLPQLEKVTGRLDFLKHVIRARDFEESQKFFDRLRRNINQPTDADAYF